MQTWSQAGWLDAVVHCPSPNCNLRPDGVSVDLLVIHNISLPPGQFGTKHIEDLFLNRLDCEQHPSYQELDGLEVSSHFLISRLGKVTQFVSIWDRAWHAGVSSFQGREGCNDFAIGIELEGTDDQIFTDEQYAQLQALTRLIQQQCPMITMDRIVGHSDIAPGRKTDPGPCFDWQRYRSGLTDHTDKTLLVAK